MKKTWVTVFVLILCSALFVMGCSKKGENKEQADKGVITIEVFDAAANYQGIQPGWFGALIKQKFNIELNVFAPQTGGGKALFQTRAAAGNLGDILILDSNDFRDSVKAGLVKDISAEISKYPNLMVFKQQIDAYNASLDGAKPGQIYGIPAQMSNTSPTKWSEVRPFTQPMIPWDYYTEIGAPKLNNLDDLLAALAAIQKAHPTNKEGDPAYGITLWADWDNVLIENVNQPLKWYGAEAGGQSPVLIGANGRLSTITDTDSPYLKILQFFYKANQLGIVDPDSGTQQWDAVAGKFGSRRAYLLWNNWHLGFWNSTERGNARENYVLAPVGDMKIFQPADTYFGSDRTWGIGSKVTDEKLTRILEFLDWYSGSEGLNYEYNGLPGFTYEKLADGTYTRTPIAETRFVDNPPVPASYGFGTGGFNDGNNWLNQWIVTEAAIDPVTKQSYLYSLWPDEIRKAATTTSKEWAAKYDGAANEEQYLEKAGLVTVVPSVNVALPSDTTDIQLIRAQCGELICDTSWKMIFARNETEFNSLWSDMTAKLNGFGYDKLVQFDKQKYQLVVDARNKALGK